MSNSLILKEKDGQYFVNGIEISEDAFNILENELNEDSIEVEENCDCEQCVDIKEIIDAVLNSDFDKGIIYSFIMDKLDKYYDSGKADTLENIINNCQEELDEIIEE